MGSTDCDTTDAEPSTEGSFDEVVGLTIVVAVVVTGAGVVVTVTGDAVTVVATFWVTVTVDGLAVVAAWPPAQPTVSRPILTTTADRTTALIPSFISPPGGLDG